MSPEASIVCGQATTTGAGESVCLTVQNPEHVGQSKTHRISGEKLTVHIQTTVNTGVGGVSASSYTNDPNNTSVSTTTFCATQLDMNPDERDPSKDGTSSQNYSAFNLNEGMLEAWATTPIKVRISTTCQHRHRGQSDVTGDRQVWHQRVLAWQRGGPQGYQDGTSYGVQGYISAVNAGKSELQSNTSLLTDSQRVATPELAHV